MSFIQQFIECDGVQIAASIETSSQEAHPIYYPANILIYMEKGTLKIENEQIEYVIPTHGFALVRKHSVCSCSKTWTETEGEAIMYAFIMQDEFIQEAIGNMPISASETAPDDLVLQLEENTILKGFFESLISYIKENEQIDRELLSLKTREALFGVLKNNPGYAHIFKAFATPFRADLENFMHHNFQHNVRLPVLAKASGRSLSTFNREFRRIFKESPHRWIMKQRLRLARTLLTTTEKRVTDIYLEIGFEDLAHFSRAFKKEFGQTPTEVKRLSGLQSS